MNGPNEYILEMNNIKKSFSGVVVLDGVHMKIRKGSVHALVGENGAGKSTLMKILSGLYKPDQGEIKFMDTIVTHLDPLKCLNMGIAMIHQELSPIPNMTIAENIFLGREITGKIGTLVNFKKMNRETTKILNNINVDFDPTKKMMGLSVAAMQMVEIAKAISRESKVIIMDEPTSALTIQEADILFDQIAKMKAHGIAIIYITHKMDEVFRISDDISVLRDGHIISTGSISDYTIDRIISEMVGRKIENIYPKKDAKIKDTVFEVKNLNRDKYFKDINFSVKRGEILGIGGLVGAGRTEVARALFGLDRHDSGQIFIEGEEIKLKHCSDAIDHGIVMASEDRKLEGLVLCRSVKENITLASLDQVISGKLLRVKKEARVAQDMVDKLRIKTNSINTLTVNLSGGNQQKVVLVKWLLLNIKVLILDEPTRGIDVGAKYEIYKLMCDLAKQGIAIIMISSELPELIGMSDRIIVMSSGHITGEVPREEADQETLMRYAIQDCKL